MFDPVMITKFQIKMIDGRPNKIECLDDEDNLICQLPATGVNYNYEIDGHDRDGVSIKVRRSRVKFSHA